MSDTTSSLNQTNQGAKFSLIELMTILILVGLVFIFVIPVHQAKVNSIRVQDAVSTMKMIGEKADDFKNNPDNGYYPDISQLNLGEQTKSRFFSYAINADDSTVVAETTPAYGKKGAYLIYSLTAKQFVIGKGDSDKLSKQVINDIWVH